MTWPFVNPASGYIGLSRFESDSRRPSISTSRRLAGGTPRLLPVHLEPDGAGLGLADAPAAGEPIHELEPDPAAAGEIGCARCDVAERGVGVRDLDAHAQPGAL